MANLQLVGNIAGSEAATVKLTVVYLTDYRDEQGRVPPPVLLFEKLPGQEWTARPNGGAAIVLGPNQMGIPAPKVSVTYTLLWAGLPPPARTLERYIVPNTDPEGYWDFTRADGNGVYNGSPDNLTQVNVLPGQGPQGEPGPGLRIGTGVPSPGLGINGDSYLNTLTWDLYSRGGGAWTLIGNIRGGTGGIGERGLPGVDGRSFPVPTPSQTGYIPVADGSQPSGFSWTAPSALRLRKLGDVDLNDIQEGQAVVWNAGRSLFVPGEAGSGDGGGDGPVIDPIAGQIIVQSVNPPNWANNGTLAQFGLGNNDGPDTAWTDVWGYSNDGISQATPLQMTYPNGNSDLLTYQDPGPWLGKRYWQFVDRNDFTRPTIFINVAEGVSIQSVGETPPPPDEGGPGGEVTNPEDFTFHFPSAQYGQASAPFDLMDGTYKLTVENVSQAQGVSLYLESAGASGIWSTSLNTNSLIPGEIKTTGPTQTPQGALHYRVRGYCAGPGNPVVHVQIVLTPIEEGPVIDDLTSFDFDFLGNTPGQASAPFTLDAGDYNLVGTCPGGTGEAPIYLILEAENPPGHWQGWNANTITDTDVYTSNPVHFDGGLCRFRAYCSTPGNYTAHVSVTLE